MHLALYTVQLFSLIVFASTLLPVLLLRPTTEPTTQFNTLGPPYPGKTTNPCTHAPTHPHSPIHPRAHETETKYHHYWRPCT